MTLRLTVIGCAAAFATFAAPSFALDPDPASATDETSSKEEKKAETKDKAEKQICRRIALDMSSRRRTKVCMTREEWKAFNRDRRGGA